MGQGNSKRKQSQEGGQESVLVNQFQEKEVEKPDDDPNDDHNTGNTLGLSYRPTITVKMRSHEEPGNKDKTAKTAKVQFCSESEDDDTNLKVEVDTGTSSTEKHVSAILSNNA